MKMRGELEKYLMDVEDCRIKLEQTISVQDM